MKTESLLKPPESRLLKSGQVTLQPKESVGWHVTDKREELIIVLQGTATIMQHNKETQVKAGETHYIKEGTSHNVVNNLDKELKYIYIVSLFQ